MYKSYAAIAPNPGEFPQLLDNMGALMRVAFDYRDDVKKLYRVAVRSVPDERLPSPAVVVLSRLVVTGGNHHRLHEELTEAGGHLRDDGFRRVERVTEVRRWLDDAVPATLPVGTFSMAATTSRPDTTLPNSE